jgi:hypothetical protein
MRTTLGLLALPLLACTTIGVGVPHRRDAIDFGPPAGVRVCVFAEAGISAERTESLRAAIDREMKPYGIGVTVPWVRPWRRPAFFTASMLSDLLARPLEPPCDRLLGLVGRHLGDTLWGFVLPETLGAVDETTHTRGVVVAGWFSPNQLLFPPGRTAVHEFYHLLGCGHSLWKLGCYEQIRRSKRRALDAPGFFPGLTKDKQPLRTRGEVDALLRERLREEAREPAAARARH